MPQTGSKPEEILDVNRRWLPPSPHIEKVIEAVEKDSAHIEKRGHHEAPLLVFEDGGVIELPKVRYAETHRGMQLISPDVPAQAGQTRHRDVCGCVEEIEGVLRDDPASVEVDPHKFDQLLDDALYMISRMYKREEAYKKFVADVTAICAQPPKGPEPSKAYEGAKELKRLLHDQPADVAKNLDRLNSLADDVRDVASNQEKCLADYKKLAIQINSLYKAIKGARNWEKDGT